MARLDGIDAAALPDDLADEIRNSLRRKSAKGQPLALVIDPAEACQSRTCGGLESGRPNPDRSVGAQDLGHAPGRDHPATVDDGDPIADLLDLAQQVRVQKHGGPSRLEGADDLPDVMPPTGSSAEVGSSRSTSSGDPSKATPSPSRCCMP